VQFTIRYYSGFLAEDRDDISILDFEKLFLKTPQDDGVLFNKPNDISHLYVPRPLGTGLGHAWDTDDMKTVKASFRSYLVEAASCVSRTMSDTALSGSTGSGKMCKMGVCVKPV